ncbi:hypothetical protein JCM16303_006589 [Sporobolomyces ruberrimus]
MGCWASNPVLDEAEKTSHFIDEEIKRSRKEINNTVKTLLLGPGESGKSTIVKQLRLVYSRPYGPDERLDFKEVVFTNTLQSMQVVIEGFELLKAGVPEELESCAQSLEGLQADDTICRRTGDFEPHVSQVIYRLWQHPATKQIVAQSSRLQLNDSASYFFDSLPRISEPGYIPTDADILRCRVRSTGIVEEVFQLGRTRLVVCDVVGQRSERRKWVSCFENVQLLIFVAALSEFDQVLYEDQDQPRFAESLLLWSSIVSSPWFSRTSLILFLNKMDLLEKKIRTNPESVEHFLPDYLGPPDNLEGVKHYFAERFHRVYGDQERALYTHFTSATDTTAMRPIFRAVMDSVITSSLAEGGFL